MKGRKPNPANLRAVAADERSGSRTAPPARVGRPPRRPRCPAYFTAEQRREFRAICRELDELGWLSSADANDIVSLALAIDKLRETTEYINLHGAFYTVVIEGRAQKCPACGGKAGVDAAIKCRGCKGTGIVRGRERRERHKAPEVMEQRYAQDTILRLCAALGLDPTSRVRIRAAVGGKAPKRPAEGTGLKAFLSG